MGNSGIKKLLYPYDQVENKYDSLWHLKALDLDKNEIDLSFFSGKPCLIVNSASQNIDFDINMNNLLDISEEHKNNI